MDSFEKIGDKIRLIRLLLGINQSQFAEVTNTKFSTINNVEQHRFLPSAEIIQKISNTVKINSEWLEYNEQINGIFDAAFIFLLLQPSIQQRRLRNFYSHENIYGILNLLQKIENVLNACVLNKENDYFFIFRTLPSPMKSNYHFIVFRTNRHIANMVFNLLEKDKNIFGDKKIYDLTEKDRSINRSLYESIRVFYSEIPTNEMIGTLQDNFKDTPTDFVTVYKTELSEILSPVPFQPMALDLFGSPIPHEATTDKTKQLISFAKRIGATRDDIEDLVNELKDLYHL